MKDDRLAEIIEQCQQGRADGFAWLEQEYGQRLYGYFLRRSGSVSEAEDLLGDLFVKLLEKISKYRHEDRFESWLFSVAANMVRDAARRRKRQGPVISLDRGGEQGSEPNVIVQDNQPGPEETVSAAEQRDLLQAALEQLVDLDREMIVMRHYGQLSFKELAEHFQVPIGTALSRVHRGLKRLGEIMKANDHERE